MMKSARTESHLIKGATWLFSQRGFHGTSVRDIADVTQATVSGMYYYASSKDELLEAVIRGGLGALIDAARETVEVQAHACERLATLIAVHVAFHAKNPHTAKVIDQEFRALSAARQAQILEERDTYEAVWKQVLQDGTARGSFLDECGVARFALLGMCTGVAQWYRPRGRLSVEQLCEVFIDLGFAAVSATKDGRPVAAASLKIGSLSEVVDLVTLASEPRRPYVLRKPEHDIPARRRRGGARLDAT